MVPEPVSHPSDVEMRELRAISTDLICQAACVGYASSCFHGFRVAAVRQQGAATDPFVNLFVERVDDEGLLADQPTSSVLRCYGWIRSAWASVHVPQVQS